VAVVNGGPPALFQGRAATEVLVPLLNALDGSLNNAGLAGALGLPEAQVERGLALLDEQGLLESF
jgi:DNA-binding IclR family transcriptional regulator